MDIRTIASLHTPRGQCAARSSDTDRPVFELDYIAKPPGLANVDRVLDFSSGDSNVEPIYCVRADGNGGLTSEYGPNFSVETVGTGGDDPTDSSNYGYGWTVQDAQTDIIGDGSANGKVFKADSKVAIGTNDLFFVWIGRPHEFSASYFRLLGSNTSNDGFSNLYNSDLIRFYLHGASGDVYASLSASLSDRIVMICGAFDRSGYAKLWYNGVAGAQADISALASDDIDDDGEMYLGGVSGSTFSRSGLSYFAMYLTSDIGTHNQDALAQKLFAQYSGQDAISSREHIPYDLVSRSDSKPNYLKRYLGSDESSLIPVGPHFPSIEQDADGLYYAPQFASTCGPFYGVDLSNTGRWNHTNLNVTQEVGANGKTKYCRLTATDTTSELVGKNYGWVNATFERLGFFIKRFSDGSSSGIIHISNYSSTSYGYWTINLANLPVDKWIWIDRFSDYITIVNEYSCAPNGYGGIVRVNTGSYDFGMDFITIEKNNEIMRPVHVENALRVLAQETPAEYRDSNGYLSAKGRVSMSVESLGEIESDVTLARLDDGTSADTNKLECVCDSAGANGYSDPSCHCGVDGVANVDEVIDDGNSHDLIFGYSDGKCSMHTGDYTSIDTSTTEPSAITAIGPLSAVRLAIYPKCVKMRSFAVYREYKAQ